MPHEPQNTIDLVHAAGEAIEVHGPDYSSAHELVPLQLGRILDGHGGHLEMGPEKEVM